ncbi:hypothetical protein [Flavobacterium marginilacus]|uniref:hypothetical protein n=1 Tax=Flavobacterium marginilacus TaxID=3003256 RepID=UPI00248D78B9|nr:hypothetical protein [Flavobacterium marginilacus]
MDTNDDLKQLALQLRETKGTAGIRIGELMNETNIKMTLRIIDHSKNLMASPL